MLGLFKSLGGLAGDVVSLAIAPVEMVVDLAGAAVQPLAESAREIVVDIKSLKD